MSADRDLLAENRRLIADRAANEKANIASRRSICEQSDRFKAERDRALAQVARVRALCDEAEQRERESLHRTFNGAPFPEQLDRESVRAALGELTLSDLTGGFYPGLTGGLSTKDYLAHCRGECTDSSVCEQPKDGTP